MGPSLDRWEPGLEGLHPPLISFPQPTHCTHFPIVNSIDKEDVWVLRTDLMSTGTLTHSVACLLLCLDQEPRTTVETPSDSERQGELKA